MLAYRYVTVVINPRDATWLKIAFTCTSLMHTCMLLEMNAALGVKYLPVDGVRECSPVQDQTQH